MTGYAFQEAMIDGTRFSIELKSVNHRFFDVKFRLPRNYTQWEPLILARFKEVFRRGRLDMALKVEKTILEPSAIEGQIEVAKYYVDLLNHIKIRLGIGGNVTLDVLSRIRDLFNLEMIQVNPTAQYPEFLALLNTAIDELNQARQSEGRHLVHDILGRLATIDRCVDLIAKNRESIVDLYRENLRKRVERAIKDLPIDNGRIESEVVMYADRSDITEEIVRIRHHLKEFQRTLKKSGAVGKKLDFFIQEMVREINTIGSKAMASTITNHVVEVKSELERIREQVQNIE